MPASRTAPHAHWVEVGYEVVARARARPSFLREALVTRGPLGELLAQEFLDEYAEADALLALQTRVDKERAEEDATRWSAERRARIETAQRALEDAFYAASFPHSVAVTALSRAVAHVLRDDLAALRVRRRAFSDLAEG